MKKLHWAIFLYGFGFAIFYTFFQNQLLNLGLKPQDIGSLVFLMGIIGAASNIPTGYYADIYGYKKLSIIGFILMFFSFLLPAIHFSVGSIFVSACLFSVSENTVLGALQMWKRSKDISSVLNSDEKKHIFFGLGSFVWLDVLQRIGMVVALSVPLLMSFLLPSRWANLNWIIAAIISIVLIIISSFVTAEESSQSKDGHNFLLITYEAFKKSAILKLFKELDQKENVFSYWILAGLIMFGFVDGIANSVFWPRIHGLNLGAIYMVGIVSALCSIFRVFGILGVNWFASIYKLKFALSGCIAVASIFMGLFVVIDNSYLAVLMWLMRIVALSFYFPSYQTLIVNSVQKNRGATFLSAASVVQLIGFSMGGVAVKVWGALNQTSIVLFATVLGVITAFIWAAVLTKAEKINLTA